MQKLLLLFFILVSFLIPSFAYGKGFPEPITEVKVGMTLDEVEKKFDGPVYMAKPDRPDDDQTLDKEWVDFYLNTECRVYLRKKERVNSKYSWLIVIFYKGKVNSMNARIHQTAYCNGDFQG